MIQCPYCSAPLTETTPACPKCSLELSLANAVMGPIPRLSVTGVTDFTKTLTRSDQKRITKAARNFHQRFPQSHISVVFSNFSAEFPLPAHLFWLFNTAGISGSDRKGGQNRDILIGIDPTRGVAGLTIGYGLEPFLGQEALDHVMQLSLPNLETGQFASGTIDIVAALTRLMEGVSSELNDMLGLGCDFAVEDKPGDY